MFLLSADYFRKYFFQKKNSGVSSVFDPDQARHYVGLDLEPNCLH